MKEFDFKKETVSEILNEIILDGIQKGASDIHFESNKDGIIIKMIINNVTYDYSKVPVDFKRNMISHIKMIANMNIMETKAEQSNIVKCTYENTLFYLHVSTLPINNDEKVIIHISNNS